MKLWDKYELLHDEFSIIAFHDAKVKNFEELDEKLVDIREKYWGGRDLPFPILLDATGQTIRDYGVRGFPTLLLIDPDGKREVWIKAPDKPGKYLIQCINYCGVGHTQMKAWLVVRADAPTAGLKNIGEKTNGNA